MNDWETRKTLLERVRDSYDESSWDDFVLYYQPFIYQVLKNMNLKHHECEDLSQTVLLKLWKSLPEFRYDKEKGRFRGWLCKITGNTVKSYFVKKNREVIGDVPQKITIPEVEKITEKEWKVYISNLAWKNIEKDLAPRAKEVFLKITKGETTPDVASSMSISESSVYVYKKRIQDRLIKEIKKLEKELL